MDHTYRMDVSLQKEQKCHVSMKVNAVIVKIQEGEFEHRYAQDVVSLVT